MYERLTMHTPDNFGYAEYQLKQYVDEQDAINRLAAYEDSGLSPEDILALADMVRRLEWSLKRKLRKTSPECEYYCPICENNKRIGHASDCELAALLKESEVEHDG